jgi:hypothetical protein
MSLGHTVGFVTRLVAQGILVEDPSFVCTGVGFKVVDDWSIKYNDHRSEKFDVNMIEVDSVSAKERITFYGNLNENIAIETDKVFVEPHFTVRKKK